MKQKKSAAVRRRTETVPLPPLVEVPETCTYRGGCPNDAMPGNTKGECELHAVYGETPPPEPDDDDAPRTVFRGTPYLYA